MRAAILLHGVVVLFREVRRYFEGGFLASGE